MASSIKDKILSLGRHSITEKEYDILYDTANGSELVVEIGARYGCSTMLFGKIAKEVISIELDPPLELYKNLRKMDLNNVKVLYAVSPWLDINEDIDYLFIDGDHRTIFCIADYVYFMPFVKVGGKIAFHDISQVECEFTVNRALDIIVDESPNLKEIVRYNEESGIVVFEKTMSFDSKERV